MTFCHILYILFQIDVVFSQLHTKRIQNVNYYVFEKFESKMEMWAEKLF